MSISKFSVTDNIKEKLVLTQFSLFFTFTLNCDKDIHCS